MQQPLHRLSRRHANLIPFFLKHSILFHLTHFWAQGESEDWWFPLITNQSEPSRSHQSKSNRCVCACAFQLFSPTWGVMEWPAARSVCAEKDARSINKCMSASVGKAKLIHITTPEYNLCFPAQLDPLSVFTFELLSRCWDTSWALQAKYWKTHAQEKKWPKTEPWGMPASHQHKWSQQGSRWKSIQRETEMRTVRQLKGVSEGRGFRLGSV